MQPLILRLAVPAGHPPWQDTPTDTDPLPSIVAIDVNGMATGTSTRITEVRQETTDDQ